MPEPSLRSDDWVIEGQLTWASNLVVRMMMAGEPVDLAQRAVYKPVQGERPLADFPPGTLAHREVANYLVAVAGGWTCVPQTMWWEGGPLGPGSLQRWVGPLEPRDQERVDLIAPDDISDDWATVAMFETDDGLAVLVHRLDPQLEELMALDVVLNNADRKGSHLIEVDDHLWGIDHGLNFHADDKLRTVLWGWAGQPISEAVRDKLERISRSRESLSQALSEHLEPSEIEALWSRVDGLLESGSYPLPPQDRYGLPWPPL